MAILKYNYLLVINSGSSSLKVTLFNHLYRVLDVTCARNKNKIDCLFTKKGKSEKSVISEPFSVSVCLGEIAIQQDIPKEGLAIAHRFVHGGHAFSDPVIIHRKNLRLLSQLVELAPLHNKSCLEGIHWALKTFGKTIPQIAVFDTAFFRHLPAVAQTYAIPQRLARKYHLIRYGFHGISHEFLWRSFTKIKGSSTFKVITLHLGNGCSMAAIKNGKPLDISMGFSPLEGLIMGTRSGDVDPAIVGYLCEHVHLKVNQAIELLNQQSGLLGLSEKTNDMKELQQLAQTNAKAALAIDMFCYRIKKYIGAYASVLGGVDALIFSGGIGENSAFIRQKILKGLGFFKIILDEKENRKGEASKKLHAKHSSVELYIIPSDENLAIARQARELFH